MMQIMRQMLDETDRRIAASLVASPRASWREPAHCLGLSERTVVRRVTPLYADGTLRATAVRNPACFPHLIPVALRIRCRPNKIHQVARALARRTDTVWVDILGGGDEISTIFFLDDPDARNTLLLRDLPATDAVGSWTSHTLLRVFPTAFRWTAGLLSPRGTGPAHPRPGTTNGATRAPRHRHRPGRGRPGHLHGTRPPRRHHRAHRPPATGHAPARSGPTPGDRARPRTVGRTRRSPAVDRRTPRRAAGDRADPQRPPARPLLRRHHRPRQPARRSRRRGPRRLYTFLTDTVGPLDGVTAIDTTPLLATVKRTGLIRH